MGSFRELVENYALTKVEELGDAFIERARGYCSRRTGALADSIQAEEPRLESNAAVVRVFVGEEYGRFQDEGTGLYGPRGERIEPTDSSVLVFDWPAAGGTVFVRSTAGAPGTHFWSRTVDEFGSVVREVAA